MLLDQHDIMGDAQTLSTIAVIPATTGGTLGVIDKGAAVNLGGGKLHWFIQLAAPTVATGTPALTAILIGADNAALTTNPITIATMPTTGTLATTDAPRLLKQEIAPHAPKRFFGVTYTTTGTTLSVVAMSGLDEDEPIGIFGT